jgi:hypothetical protein
MTRQRRGQEEADNLIFVSIGAEAIDAGRHVYKRNDALRQHLYVRDSREYSAFIGGRLHPLAGRRIEETVHLRILGSDIRCLFARHLQGARADDGIQGHL